jgi:hypothetical protein
MRTGFSRLVRGVTSEGEEAIMDVRNIINVAVISVGLGLLGLSGCASGPSGGGGDDDDTAGTACSALTDIPAGDDPTVIDDLEDGDEGIAENGARVGAWYSFNDGTATGTQDPSDKVDFKPSMESACGMYAARTTGKGFTDWGAGIGLDLNAPTPASGPEIKLAYDASAYTGVAFEAKGNSSIRFQIAEIATVPMAEGGSCTPSDVEGMMCEDGHGKTVALSKDWKTYKVPFSELTQEGFGPMVAFDKKTITGFQWSVLQNLTFDFSIDNVRFY